MIGVMDLPYEVPDGPNIDEDALKPTWPVDMNLTDGEKPAECLSSDAKASGPCPNM